MKKGKKRKTRGKKGKKRGKKGTRDHYKDSER